MQFYGKHTQLLRVWRSCNEKKLIYPEAKQGLLITDLKTLASRCYLLRRSRFCYSVNRSCPMINIIIWKYLKYVWLCCMISNTYGTTKWPSSVNQKKKKLKFRLVLYCLWTDKIIVALLFFLSCYVLNQLEVIFLNGNGLGGM